MHTQNDSLTESPSTTTQSQFYLNGRRISLSTSCSISMKPLGGDGGMQFINYPCEVMEDQLRKCYKIVFRDGFISVQDKITLDSTYRNFQKQHNNHQPNKEHKSNRTTRCRRRNKKTVLFKNTPLTQRHPHGRNDKKNIAKNVVNAFLRYMRDNLSQDDPAAKTVYNSVLQLAKTIKYNNQLISAIVEQPSQMQYFKQFLSGSAGGWLQQSKIKTKQIYEQAIRIYYKLCDERQVHNGGNRAFGGSKESSNSNNSICFRQLQNYELQQQIRGFK